MSEPKERTSLPVLVVDDQPELLLLIKRILTKGGYQVFTASNGAECLQQVRENRPLIILLDVDLPDTDGFTLCRQIKSAEKPAPFVYLISGAKVMPADVSEGLEGGADGYLLKPVGERELLARMAAATRIVNAELAYIASEKRFRSLFANMQQPFAVYKIDTSTSALLPSYRFEEVNPAFEQLCGLPQHQITGKTLLELLPDTESALLEKFHHVATTGGQLVFEAWLEPFDRHFEIVVYQHQPGFLAVIFVDVTHRIRQQKLALDLAAARQSVQFKQNFLANMSHEIRSPVTGILGIAEILKHSLTDASNQDHIHTLMVSTRHLQGIIDQILDYSSIEAGKIQVRPKSFSLNNMLRDAGKLIQPHLQEGVAFEIHHETTLPENLVADPVLVQRVLMKLLNNAARFTPAGKITLRVAARSRQHTEGYIVRMAVHDTGQGVPLELQPSLFQPFALTEREDVRTHEGTGLGLVISKQLVETLGGETGFESQEGKGSTFWFSFPAEAGQDNQAAGLQPRKLADKAAGGLHILLVEDKEVNQKVLALMLRGMGHEVSTANHGGMAIEMFRPGRFDLILMDIQMPVMDGVTATQKLKATGEQLPPIVGLSANAFEGDRERYMQQGLDEYITKPVQVKDLDTLFRRLNL
jgi:two-component system, sensor histidine kinase